MAAGSLILGNRRGEKQRTDKQKNADERNPHSRTSFSLVIGGRAAGDAENFLVPIEECSSSDSLRCVFLSSRHNKPLHLCLYDMASNPFGTLFRAQIAADIRRRLLLLHCRQHSLIN